LKEVVFTTRNSTRWKDLENKLSDNQPIDPETLSKIYIRLSDDLSYARTYYPESKITLYINNLVVKIHHLIYKNKKTDPWRFVAFWKSGYPMVVRRCHRYLLYSFLVFAVSVCIGWISSRNDSGFVRLILGDRYVNMTMENIRNNDPLAVYKQMNQVEMFLGITLNNIYVSFLAYVFGLFISIGSGFILFKNGIMMGSFLYLFFSQGLLINSVLTIFIHGTLEIFAILMAGAAGIMLGNSILFPGTYSRLASFGHGVADSIRVLAGLIPLFILAGFLEGFVTRMTEISVYLKLAIILCSLLIILIYFIVYPIKILKSHGHARNNQP
jgi:uncharacterized membrane protein SpoIIM required for sporulation